MVAFGKIQIAANQMYVIIKENEFNIYLIVVKSIFFFRFAHYANGFGAEYSSILYIICRSRPIHFLHKYFIR